MFKIILSLGLTLLFAFAQNCNFNDDNQDECEIDIKNPPLMLHKFVNDDGSEFTEYHACIIDANIEIDGVQYGVLDCSMIKDKNGKFTEGVTINNGKNLIKNKLITIKQDNVLLRVAGDFIIDSGVRLNIKNPKHFIVEIINGTNEKSNLILQRGASLKAEAIFMPNGKNSNIHLNTFYGGIYEKEFIDLINQKSPKMRGGMETMLNVDNVLALNDEGEILEFDGSVSCGPEVNPLDLSNKDYMLKRLFRVKNTSVDKPSENNAICDIKEKNCFENILDFANRKIDGKSYKIATAKADIIPTYEIFIESGKIISSDNRGIKDIMPEAKVQERHYGKCETPAKIAFEKSVVDEYLANIEAKKAQLAQKSAKDSTQNAESIEQKPAESTAESIEQKQPDSTQLAQIDAETVEEIIEEFAMQNAESTQNAESANASNTPAQSQKGAESLAESAIESPAKPAESAIESATQKPAEQNKPDSTQLAQNEKSSTQTSDSKNTPQNENNSPISAELNAELNENLQDLLSAFNSENLAESSQNTPANKNTAESSTNQGITADINISKNTPVKAFEASDEFLIVEKKAYEQFNKECYGDLQCLYDSLLPYDKVIWNKKSSKNMANAVYVLNFTNDNLAVKCEVKNHYGKNLKKSFNLSSTNIIGVLDVRFPASSDTTQITCKADKQTKTTNKIIATPASFDIKYSFADEGSQSVPTLKAGKITIAFKQGTALTMEGDIDSGFSGDLAVENVAFKQKNKCDGSMSENISTQKNLKLNFKKGYLKNASMDIMAKTIAFGDLNIDFNIANNDKTCTNSTNSLMPECTTANITKEISIIPANFRIKTDILSTSNKISYYGQIDDKRSFKYNPLLSIELEALDNDNKPIDINKNCNYGSIELSLKSDKLIEFKRTSSDRINSKIIVYLRDFQKPTGTNIQAYFGINKLVDKYNASRKIAQNDLLEPIEITLFDFLFDVRFKNGKSQFSYENPEVYDRLDDNSNPISVLIARGKLQTNDIKGDTQDAASLIAKYAIYCKSCDRKVLAKYLKGEPEAESQYWYINNQHPSSFYISDNFIKIRQKSGENSVTIANSNNAFEGRQQISFGSKNAGIYAVAIAQRSAEFAPYLNYSDKYKNSYIQNGFNVMISESTKEIFENIEDTAKVAEPTPAEPKQVVTPKPTPQKPTTKPKPKKPSNKPSGNVILDIEE